ncbi:hypothetical protein Tco_1024821 [Tanacetum coccineum]
MTVTEEFIIIESNTSSDDPTCDDTTSDDPYSDNTTSDDITYAPKTTARKGPPKELLKWDGITDKDISQFQVAAKHSKLKGYTSKPLKVLGLASAHTWACIGNKTFGLMRTFLNFKSQQNIPSQKVPPPSHKRFHLKATKGLASTHTWACIDNKTFGIGKPIDGIISDQDSKGKKEGWNRKKICRSS